MEVNKLKEKLCKGVKPSEDDNQFRKVQKVLAPFLQTLKKRRHSEVDIQPLIHEELYLKKSPKDLLNLLRSGFKDPLKLRTLMNETAELLKVVTKSKSVNVYLANYDLGEIMLLPKYYPQNPRFDRKYHIETGTYLAAHVAYTKEYVISSDILGDVRFPLGIPDVLIVKSAMCVPIITDVDENCIGVIELYRECSEKPYDLVNLQICNALTAWMGIAVEENKERLNILKEMSIQKELSQMANLYFARSVSFHKITSEVLEIIKVAANAERGGFYVFLEPVSPQSDDVIVADAYEEGSDESDETVLHKKVKEIRFVKNQPGIPGYAARTGEIVNVFDAYKDFRFDRKTDSAFYRTRSVVAFPLKNEIGVLGVLKLVNSKNSSHFRVEDIDLVQSFLPYITIFCGYYLLDKSYNKMQHRMEIIYNMLGFHTKPSGEDVTILRYFVQGDPHLPPIFFRFDWDAGHYEEDALKYIMFVFMNSEILEPCFEVQNLADFLLRVKKSYRNVIYHNFEHAFSVFHFVFIILLKIKEVYSASEIVTLLLTALCHDIGHMGLTNSFLSLINDPKYKLYGDFCGESHRFDYVLFLIQETDLMSNVSRQTYQTIQKNMKNLFLGFDLMVHFQNRLEITKLLNSGSFDWENQKHRLLTQNMILITSDFSTSFKSFESAKKHTTIFYRELYRQGDLEKSMGYTPLPMLDRSKNDMHPENQIILLTIVVHPVVEILVHLFPKLNVLNELLTHTLTKWNETIQSRGQELWMVNQALVKEKRTQHKVTLSSTLSSIKTVISVDTRSVRA